MDSQISHATNVRDCCSSHLQSVDITGTLLEAAQKMAYKRVGALAVLRQGSLVGVITESDLVCAMAEGSSATTTVVDGGSPIGMISRGDLLVLGVVSTPRPLVLT